MQFYMDYHSLDSAVQGYFAAGLAPPNPFNLKDSRTSIFIFCSSFHITPLPTTEASLFYFVACLHGSAGSGSFYHSHLRISAVRDQAAHGYKDFNFEHMLRLCQVIKGLKISQGHGNSPMPSNYPLNTTLDEGIVVSF